jgi:succinyl-CoA synthetase alpha subunit
MSILINKDTKVITQGITGKTGQFHTLGCQAYANGKAAFVAGVNPKKAGEKFSDIPIYASVKEAAGQTGATVSVIYVPPAGAAAAIWEAVEADLDLAICITEGIPVRDMLEVRNKMKAKEAAGGKKTLLLGPNCPGLITPEEIKIGIMPGHIHRKGRIGVVSRSGTLTYEAVAQLTEIGLGQSSAVGIGGDPINGLKHIDVMRAFNDDPDTDAVIMIGEIGGPDEAEAARWCKANMRKPIVGFIAGVTAPAGKRMGHAGALISGGADTADAKLAIMEECGFTITRNPSEMGRLLKAPRRRPGQQLQPAPARCRTPCRAAWVVAAQRHGTRPATRRPGSCAAVAAAADRAVGAAQSPGLARKPDSAVPAEAVRPPCRANGRRRIAPPCPGLRLPGQPGCCG